MGKFALHLAFVCLAGCGGQPKETLPLTFPVTGTVVDQAGKPLAGGAFYLHSPAHPTLTIVGEIKADGTFTVLTLGRNIKADGAPEGTYKVTVVLPSRSAEPIELGKEYDIKAGGDNNLLITVGNRK